MLCVHVPFLGVYTHSDRLFYIRKTTLTSTPYIFSINAPNCIIFICTHCAFICIYMKPI